MRRMEFLYLGKQMYYVRETLHSSKFPPLPGSQLFSSLGDQEFCVLHHEAWQLSGSKDICSMV